MSLLRLVSKVLHVWRVCLVYPLDGLGESSFFAQFCLRVDPFRGKSGDSLLTYYPTLLSLLQLSVDSTGLSSKNLVIFLARLVVIPHFLVLPFRFQHKSKLARSCCTCFPERHGSPPSVAAKNLSHRTASLYPSLPILLSLSV